MAKVKSNSIVILYGMILAICFAPVSLLLIHSDPSITVLLSLPPLSLILFQIPLSLSVSG